MGICRVSHRNPHIRRLEVDGDRYFHNSYRRADRDWNRIEKLPGEQGKMQTCFFGKRKRAMRSSEREEVKIKGGEGAEKLKMKTKSLLLKVGLKKEKGMSLRFDQWGGLSICCW
jgi:hypothetical protein